VIERIRALPAYQRLVENLHAGKTLPGLGLMRSARLPLLAALHQDWRAPLLLITDRTDRALLDGRA